MKEKILWIDCETLSFNREQSDIIQLAGLVTIDNKIVDKFNFYIKPDVFDEDKILPDIWQFHQEHLNKSKEEILGFKMTSAQATEQLLAILDKYCDRYDKTDKFKVGGYNVDFDIGKLSAMFKFNNFKYLGAYLSSQRVDPMHLVPFCIRNYPFNKMKLVDMWSFIVDEVGVEVPEKLKSAGAHNALIDILRTYTIYTNICLPFISNE